MNQERFFHFVAQASECRRRISEARREREEIPRLMGNEGEDIYQYEDGMRVAELRAEIKDAMRTQSFIARQMEAEGFPLDINIQITRSAYVRLSSWSSMDDSSPRLAFEDVPTREGE